MKKRILALLTAAALLLTAAAMPTQATQPTRPVEMSDVLDILKSLVGIAAPLSLDYDFNQNGIIDTGDALEGLKSLIGAREVILLPVKTGIVTTPLTAEMDLRLRTDWVNPAWMQPEHYEGRTPDNAEVVMYLGTYHTERFGKSIVVVMDCIYRPFTSPPNFTYRDRETNREYEFVNHGFIHVWNNGQFYALAPTLAARMIPEQDLEEIQNLTNAIEIPDTLQQKAFELSAEMEQRIISDLNNFFGLAYNLYDTLSIHVGMSNNKIALLAGGSPAAYVRSVNILDYTFVTNSSYMYIWNNGEISRADEAFEEGWLTVQEVVGMFGWWRGRW